MLVKYKSIVNWTGWSCSARGAFGCWLLYNWSYIFSLAKASAYLVLIMLLCKQSEFRLILPEPINGIVMNLILALARRRALLIIAKLMA